MNEQLQVLNIKKNSKIKIFSRKTYPAVLTPCMQSGILEEFSKVLQISISGMVELKEIGQRYL